MHAKRRRGGSAGTLSPRLEQLLGDPRIRAVASLEQDSEDWRADLDRLLRADRSLTRDSAGEAAIKAVQRLLVFLGYSTSIGGSFRIDGDFGRGTNRGVAQFQLEHGLDAPISRRALCYPCTFQTASKKIVAIPDVTFDVPTLKALLTAVLRAIDRDDVTFGNFDDALFHLNALATRRFLDCREILARYGPAVSDAIDQIQAEAGFDMQPEWVLSIIKQETDGIVRPRFEQHKLSKFNANQPRADFSELRFRSMSIGLGQIMGFNHARVGASSAREMLHSPPREQVLYVARFLLPKKRTVAKREPTDDDYRTVARFYNGPGYEAHFYHEGLQRRFREFRTLLAGS